MKKIKLLPLLLAALLPLSGCLADNVPEASNTPSAAPTFSETPAPEDTSEIEYELYTGEVPHIFTHCLIAYPEVKDASGKMLYDNDCINVTEFKNLLNELYNNGYSLVDVHDIYHRDENGLLRLKEAVEVPAGRKPLVFSVDDVVYDYKKRGNGMVDLLTLDTEGNLVSGTYQPDGLISYSYDREVFTILERFIAEHPDFSSHGSRMTLCMTGFAGAFGFRTDSDYPGDRQGEIEKAKAVAGKLKELGYTFASHSYAHSNHEKMSEEALRRDLQQFSDEVVPIIGPVSVYIYPYGILIPPEDSRYAAMQEFGFEMFCSVAHFFYSRNYDDGQSLYMTRVAVDGYSLRNYHEILSPLFDTDRVIDLPNRS